MSTAYAVYRLMRGTGIYRYMYREFSWLERYLKGSGIRTPYRVYIALAGFACLMTAAAVALAVSLYLYMSGVGLPHALVRGLLLSFPSLLVVLALSLYLPVLRYNNRRTFIDARLPAFYAVMASLAAGGLSPVSLLFRAYRARRVTGIDVEFEEVARRIALGTSPSEALEEVSRITPSQQLSYALKGLSSLVESGTGISEYLTGLLDDSLRRLESRLKELLEALSLYMELYISAGVIFPLLAATLLVFLGGLGGMPFDPYAVMGLIIFVVLPVIFAAVMLLVDTALSSVRG